MSRPVVVGTSGTSRSWHGESVPYASASPPQRRVADCFDHGHIECGDFAGDKCAALDDLKSESLVIIPQEGGVLSPAPIFLTLLAAYKDAKFERLRGVLSLSQSVFNEFVVPNACVDPPLLSLSS